MHQEEPAKDVMVVRPSLKAFFLVALTGTIACSAIACGSCLKTRKIGPVVTVQPAQGTPVETEEIRLTDVVAPHILPLTKGPWPKSIWVTDKAITFRKTGKIIPYHNIRYCRRTGEGPTSRLEYDVPVCLPSGKGLALFEAAYGYECWNAHIEFYNPDGRLLSTKDVIAWPSFSPDGERYINYIWGNDYDEDRDWKGVQLCGISGAICFDLQLEKARRLIREKTGNDFDDGGFYHGPNYDIWVAWDRAWAHFAFAFWAAPEGNLAARSFYLFVYAAEGNLISLVPLKKHEDMDSAIIEAIDNEFLKVGTSRGGSK